MHICLQEEQDVIYFRAFSLKSQSFDSPALYLMHRIAVKLIAHFLCFWCGFSAQISANIMKQ